MRVSAALGCQLNGWGHEFRTYGVNNRLRKDPINLGRGGRIDPPPGKARDRAELVRSSGTPKRDGRVLAVENPTQGEMDDAPSVVGLREPVEPLNRPQILCKTGSLELGIVLSKIIARKLRLSRHTAGEETSTQGPVGEGDDVFVPTIGEDVVLDGAFKHVVGRLHRLHWRNLAEGLDLVPD